MPERGDVWHVDIGALWAASANFPRSRCDSWSKHVFARRGPVPVSPALASARASAGNAVRFSWVLPAAEPC